MEITRISRLIGLLMLIGVLAAAAACAEELDNNAADDGDAEVAAAVDDEETEPEPTEPAEEAESTDEAEPEPTEAPESEPADEPEPEPTPEPEKEEAPQLELEADPRSNPLSRGEVALIGDWEVWVIGTTPDATDLVLAENQFNDPPAEGHQFFIARIEATYIGPDFDRFDGSYRMRAVGQEAVSYSTFSNSCGVIPEPLDDPDVYSGGSIAGNICWEIRSQDAESLIMFNDDFLGGEERHYLALYEGEPIPVADPGEAPSEQLDPDQGTRENPIPAGTWVDLGDGWHMRVLESTPDATQQILDENQFNESPPTGQQFFMATIEASYYGSGSDRFDATYRLRAVGSEGIAYTTFSDSCGVVPNIISDPEVFPGGNIKGNICWSIDSNDASSLVSFDDSFFTSGDRVYMNLH